MNLFIVSEVILLSKTCLLFMVIRPSKVLAVPLENGDGQVQRSIDQRPCEVGPHGCSGFSFPDLNWTRHAVEPRTGIEFPVILDNILAEEHKSCLTSEVNINFSLLPLQPVFSSYITMFSPYFLLFSAP